MSFANYIEATFSLAYRGSLDSDYMSHDLLSGSSVARQERLRSKRLFVPAARNLINNLTGLDIRASQWTNYRWNKEFFEITSRLHVFIPMTSARPVGLSLPQTAWVKLNCLRIGVLQFHLSMHKWGLTLSSNRKFGASEQTADHVVLACFIHWAPHGARGLTVLDNET